MVATATTRTRRRSTPQGPTFTPYQRIFGKLIQFVERELQARHDRKAARDRANAEHARAIAALDSAQADADREAKQLTQALIEAGAEFAVTSEDSYGIVRESRSAASVVHGHKKQLADFGQAVTSINRLTREARERTAREASLPNLESMRLEDQRRAAREHRTIKVRAKTSRRMAADARAVINKTLAEPVIGPVLREAFASELANLPEVIE